MITFTHDQIQQSRVRFRMVTAPRIEVAKRMIQEFPYRGDAADYWWHYDGWRQVVVAEEKK